MTGTVPAHASAPGKLILLGEHAVVYGEASLSLAVDRRTHVDAEPAGGRTTVNGYPLDAAHHSYIAKAMQLAWNGGALRLRTRSDLPSASGLGSSAALSVATVASLLRLAGSPLDRARVAELAFAAEFETQGAASPNDTTVSTAGGGVVLAPRPLAEPGLEPLWTLRRDGRTWVAHRTPLPRLPLVVGVTGERSRTAEQVAKVRRLLEADPGLRSVVPEIGRLVLEAVRALRQNDLARLGVLMNENHGLLQRLRVDSPGLNRLVDLARAAPGTLGAKLTGAGGGGSIVVLTERPEDARERLVASGAHAFLVQPDPRGVEATP